MPVWVVDLLGWVGAALILAAYALVSARRLEGDAVAYQVPNLVGGLFLILNTIYYGAYPSTAVNLVWAGVAIWALLARARRRAT